MKRSYFLAALFLPVIALGQSVSSPSHQPAMTTAGAFFALSVADLGASIRWYEEKLGLEVHMRQPKQDGVAVAILEGGGLIVELVQHDKAAPLSTAARSVTDPSLVNGIFKAGVIVDDFDKTLATLRDRKVDIAFGPYPSRPNQRANVIVKDNNGNLIQFFGK